MTSSDSAVERQLEIVGEALGKLARVDSETAGKIPELPRIVAFRNRLIHGYGAVDHGVVWGICRSRLPELAETLKDLQTSDVGIPPTPCI